MKSIKPGRGPSFMGGMMAIFVAFFGVIWTIMASAAGGPFMLFGIGFVIIAICMAVYNFKNATGKNRYSAYDITDEHEEPDPLNTRFGAEGKTKPGTPSPSAGEVRFCPYCGTAAEKDFEFCKSCGKKLP